MANSKTEKMIICGPSGSGKDFLQRQVVAMGLRHSPKVTTRPMREGERDGFDYRFVTDEQFAGLVERGEVKTKQTFSVDGREWHYAITRPSFEEGQVFIMTPGEIAQLTPDERKAAFVVYLAIDEGVRMSRVSRRQDHNDSVARRFLADRADFEGFEDYDMKVTDPEFDPELVMGLML